MSVMSEAVPNIVSPGDRRGHADPAPARPTLVTLRDASVRLGGRTIWDNASLDIAAGEFIAILGPNGAGKSTLLRVLLGLQPLSAGTASVLGRAPSRGDSDIGYVPQRRQIDPELPARGRDLVHLGIDGHRWGLPLPGGRARRRQAVDAAIEAVDAGSYAGRPIGRLSGGEQQRLLLAQALVGEPRLLLLDEPLASLDLRNQGAIASLVGRVARERGMTVMLVTHDVNPLIRIVDRLLYVARGGILLGTPDEVLTGERLSALYGSPVDVVTDRAGRIFVVGLEDEVAHPHGADHDHAGHGGHL